MKNLLFIITSLLLFSCKKITINNIDLAGNNYIVRLKDNQYYPMEVNQDSIFANYGADSQYLKIYGILPNGNRSYFNSNSAYSKDGNKIISHSGSMYSTATIVSGNADKFVLQSQDGSLVYFFKIP